MINVILAAVENPATWQDVGLAVVTGIVAIATCYILFKQ